MSESQQLQAQKTYHVTRNRLTSSSGKFEIQLDGEAIYNTDADSSSSHPAVTITRANKGGFLSAAKFDRHDDSFAISLDEAHTSQMDVVYREGNAGTMDAYHAFNLGGIDYAWQKCLHRVYVNKPDGSTDKTMGADWKLVVLEKNKASPDNKVLAAHISLPQSWKRAPGTANIYWFETLDDTTEAASLAAIVGIIDRVQKSSKEHRSGTSMMYS